MAARNTNQPFISVSVANTHEVKRMLDGMLTAASLTFSKKTLEHLLLRRHRERFDELRANENAQRDPDGTVWQKLADSTEKTHKNPNRILYRTGALRRSVRVLRSNMGPAVVQTNTGGGFRIGVSQSSKASKYARMHNYGDPSQNLPERRFLGISDKDVAAVDRFIERNFLKSGIVSS